MNSLKRKLILSLHEIGAIKFGSFKLKSGLTSPFYVDLRLIVSFPKITDLIIRLLQDAVEDLRFDLITGIPYTALPVTSILSSKLNVPLVYQRKEPKAYGTGKSIEGVYKKGDTCLVIDDVMTTGESKIEIADALMDAGMIVKDFVIIVDRSFEGQAFLKKHNYNLHALVTIQEIIETLFEESFLTAQQKSAVENFIAKDHGVQQVNSLDSISDVTSNKATSRLIRKMIEKKSNLIISLDVDNQKSFFDILEKVADEIVMVKTHVDILNDFDPGFVKRLQDLALEKNFLIFEDRKFADIGSTVRKQFFEGVYKIADWADFVTVHSLPGEGIVKGLFKDTNTNCSSFLLAAMSAKGNLISDTYTRTTIAMGADNKDCVSGFIGFAKNVEDLKKLKAKIPQDMLLLMPGVNLDSSGDNLGQQYVSVKQAISGGADAIIVGRGIISSTNPKKEAARYRKEAWDAMEECGRIV
ncbi:MAG: orotidine-5'-phosphate decarboxylase [Calditrichaeota bacterium]|nr:MAG: orotidine-5'-phosphate decarboxylase [Calditrichota bacterium]MBL1204389.1 orotidine-5'-phosphate decarboxylase [Calditrichota bacterium]NOG44218.1 orotidine-5'-phosphate decarboxylase [Calditrichota bacterium]